MRLRAHRHPMRGRPEHTDAANAPSDSQPLSHRRDDARRYPFPVFEGIRSSHQLRSHVTA